MTWVQIDDAMDEHPKILALSHAAFRAHIEALCFANRRLTDGFVPHTIGRRRGKRAADELVTAGVWEPADGGYRIHDYGDYQLSRDEVLELRAKRSEAGRAGARARWGGDGKPHPNRMASAIATQRQNDAPNPQSQSKQPVLGQSSSTTSPAIDHQIRNGTGLDPGVAESILDLVKQLPDATDGTIGRLVTLAKRGAQQADFHDARAGVAATKSRHPSRVACTIVANRLKERA
jgi:hypothetical protein